ncbi:hypothetical protein MTO96_031175, partial [Rhipicephalus appendiculatus]
QGKGWLKVRMSTQQHTLRVRTTMSYLPGMNKIAEEALDLLDQLMDENGKVENCFTFMQRWALESVALASVDARLGCLRHPLDLKPRRPRHTGRHENDLCLYAEVWVPVPIFSIYPHALLATIREMHGRLHG